jgi:hypothetical protein
MLWITLVPLMLLGVAIAVVPLVIGLKVERNHEATVPATAATVTSLGQEEALPLAAGRPRARPPGP